MYYNWLQLATHVVEASLTINIGESLNLSYICNTFCFLWKIDHTFAKELTIIIIVCYNYYNKIAHNFMLQFANSISIEMSHKSHDIDYQPKSCPIREG